MSISTDPSPPPMISLSTCISVILYVYISLTCLYKLYPSQYFQIFLGARNVFFHSGLIFLESVL